MNESVVKHMHPSILPHSYWYEALIVDEVLLRITIGARHSICRHLGTSAAWVGRFNLGTKGY